MKFILAVVTLITLTACSSSEKVIERNEDELVDNGKTISNYSVSPGEVVVMRLPLLKTGEKPRLYCKNMMIPLMHGTEFFTAFLPESYFSNLDPYSCLYKFDDGSTIKVADVSVKEKEYPSEQLKVDKKRIVLSEEDQARVDREQLMLNKLYKSSTGTILFGDPFKLPLKTKVTSIFGTRRVYNNMKKGQHLGTDFRARVGRPIRVSNSGKVVLAMDLFYTGNTVIVDHGLGVFTLYGHLSRMDVGEGDMVKRADVVGLAGKTGRVTGPHLHWGVKVHGQLVDGMSLIRETSRNERLWKF